MAGFHSATSFRTLGAAATTHNLFTIENTAGSAVNIAMRRLLVQLDATVALTAVMPQVKTSRTTGIPTGGTTLTKAQWDTAVASAANVIVRGATASDGGGATAITATPGAQVVWQQYCMRLHTAVGQVLAPDNNLLPALVDNPSLPNFLIRAGEAILVQVVAAVGTSNPATNHWFVSAAWDEVAP